VRGAIIPLMRQPPDQNPELERAIVGALRSQIRDHGPITPEWIGSAAKRILGQLGNAKPSGLARALGRRRTQLLSPEELTAFTSAGGTSRWKGVSKTARRVHATKAGAAGAASGWAKMTPEERSAEMKRRAQVRAEKRKAT